MTAPCSVSTMLTVTVPDDLLAGATHTRPPAPGSSSLARADPNRHPNLVQPFIMAARPPSTSTLVPPRTGPWLGERSTLSNKPALSTSRRPDPVPASAPPLHTDTDTFPCASEGTEHTTALDERNLARVPTRRPNAQPRSSSSRKWDPLTVTACPVAPATTLDGHRLSTLHTARITNL